MSQTATLTTTSTIAASICFTDPGMGACAPASDTAAPIDAFVAGEPKAPSSAEHIPFITRGREAAKSFARAFNDYSAAQWGIDLRALDPKGYTVPEPGDAIAVGAMAMSGDHDTEDGSDPIGETTPGRTEPPSPAEQSSFLKRVLNYYLGTPAISVPTIEMTVFALFASLLHYGVSCVAARGDPSIEPELVVYSVSSVAKLGAAFLGVATFFFGSNAYPEFMRPTVSKVIGLGKYIGKPLRWLGGKMTFGPKDSTAAIASLPGEAIAFAGEMLADPKMRENGFILGACQEIKSRYDTTILEHPYLGLYTTGDARIWGAELMINGLYIFPAVALSLGIPFWETVAPALGISFAATLASARMSKLWGEDPRYIGRIVLGRTAIFAFANTVAPLAATLLKTGTMAASAGYAIQFGLTALMSLGALGLIRPPKKDNSD